MKLKKIVNTPFVKGSMRYLFKYLSDKQVINLQYRITLNRRLNLKEPKRFTEKIHWYKLNYRTSIMTQCADKYRVRSYIQGKGYEEILVKLYQVCDSYEDIDFASLPDSFVIKSNKGSGTNLFIKDKNKLNKSVIEKTIKQWKTVNTVLMGREWAYQNIKDKIVIEELLVDNSNKTSDINDYKFLCFNGKVEYIWVDTDRHDDHRRNFYNINWEKLNVQSDWPNTNNEILKPDGFEYMVQIAESIAKDFPFVRVDFYWVNGKVYFGEITFYPWSGCVKFVPDSFDYEMGDLFKLPIPTVMK
ncbi:ATP-grasp fold amidoligase family protein [Cytobacillus sp. FSL R7-0680]|uniref:ATP-grasp fold amidoligase family protein n=1 Tax=Cytobacillus sp. FSL R7-0680 TaxID=2921689 RepID=UPI0030F979BD